MIHRKKKNRKATTHHSNSAASEQFTTAEWRRLHLPGLPGKITADPEVRAFVDGMLEAHSFRVIAEACAEKFGLKRSPGRSAVHRYWMRHHAARVRRGADR